MDSNSSSELELINQSRNSEIVVLEQSPPGYGFDFETETKKGLSNPENTTFELLLNDITCSNTKCHSDLACSVHKVGDDVPSIENVDASGGYRKNAKVQVGKLILKYEWVYIGR